MERLQTAATDDERTNVIEQFLVGQIRHSCEPRVLRSVNTIQRNNGTVSVRSLAAERRLGELFRI